MISPVLSDLPNIFEEQLVVADDRVKSNREALRNFSIEEVLRPTTPALAAAFEVSGRVVGYFLLNAVKSIYYVRLKAVDSDYSFLWRDTGVYGASSVDLKVRVGFNVKVSGTVYGRVQKDIFLDKVRVLSA